MSIRFNANEVFLMAERMEQNAAAFYRRAAELNPSEHNQKFLHRLADMEDDHKKTFGAMRGRLGEAAKEATAYDPMDEALLYLETMADTTKAEGAPEKRAQLTGQESMEQILRIAIGLEGQAILFYMGIKDLVPEKLGKGKIDEIIREERSHVVILSKELKGLKK